MSNTGVIVEKSLVPEAETSGRSAVRALLAKNRVLIQYFIIGSTASVIDVVLFVVLHNVMDQSTLVSQIVSVSSAVLFSFVINARHNFKTTDRVALRMALFSMVCLFGMLLGYAIIELGVLASIDANIGKLLSLPVVFVVQYVMNSRITFRKFAN